MLEEKSIVQGYKLEILAQSIEVYILYTDIKASVNITCLHTETQSVVASSLISHSHPLA